MSKRTPPAPDYTAAANAQAAGSRQVTEQQTWANRPTQITPFGTVSWQASPTYDPATGQSLNQWTQTTELNPQSQAALDSQMAITQGRSDTAAGMLDRVRSEFAPVMDWSQFQQVGAAPTPQQLNQGPQAEQLQRSLDFSGAQQIDPSQRYLQRAEDALYGRFAARQEPRFQRETAALETELRNRGVKPGDEAYDRALADMRQSQNDAREQATFQSILNSGSEASRMYGMDLSTRQQQVGETGTQGQFANQAAGQNFAQGIQSAGFQNQAAGQGFNQQLTASNYQSQLRQQQIAEEMQRRGFSLNEINALLTGQQVGMPSMPQFNQAQRSEAPQYLNAANMQYQAGLDAFNAQQAAIGNVLGAVTSPFSFGFGG